jgi:hypothetical protein
MQYQRVKTRVSRNYLKRISCRRITVKYALDVFLELFKHVYGHLTVLPKDIMAMVVAARDVVNTEAVTDLFIARFLLGALQYTAQDIHFHFIQP